jgi:exodeoxyribonuclease VII small subunit
MTRNNEIADMTFEAALAELDETVAKLEAGELSLEESLALFERGQLLATHCQQQLENATLRVEQLTTDGELVPLE